MASGTTPAITQPAAYGNSISTFAKRCKVNLESLHTELVAEPERDEPMATISTLYNLKGRFNVWGQNLRAFDEGRSKSSLSHRLRKAPKFAEAIIMTLGDISEAAVDAMSILKDEVPDRGSADLRQLLDSVNAEHPVNQELKEFLSSFSTEFNDLIDCIRLSVDRLYEFATLIQRQSKENSNQRLPPEIEIPGIDPGRDNHVIRVQDKYRGLSDKPWLSERLGDAFYKRRAAILRTQAKSSKPAGGASESATPSQWGSSRSATTFDEERLNTSESRNYCAPSVTEATSFAMAFHGEESTELGHLDLDRLKFRHVQLRYGETFECPFCHKFQLMSSKIQWQRHVYTDLQPYVCTFKECSLSLFATRHEWFSHEMEFHRRKWHCPNCASSLDTAELMQDHLLTAHPGIVPESDVPMIVRSSSRPIQDYSSQSCPFCEWKMPAARAREPLALCRHIAEHFQEVCLLAIPASIDELEVKEENDDTYPASESNDSQENGQPSSTRSSLYEDTSSIHLTTEVRIGGQDGEKTIVDAMWLNTINYNVVTEKVATDLRVAVRHTSRNAWTVELPQVGSVTLDRYVSAPISDATGEDWEYDTDFFVLPEDLDAADVILGSYFLTRMSSDGDLKPDRIREESGRRQHVLVSYRIRRSDLEQWLVANHGPDCEVNAIDGAYIVTTPDDVPQLTDRDVMHLRA